MSFLSEEEMSIVGIPVSSPNVLTTSPGSLKNDGGGDNDGDNGVGDNDGGCDGEYKDSGRETGVCS